MMSESVSDAAPRHARARRQIDAAGIAVIVLASCVGGGWLLGVANATFLSRGVSDQALDFLAGIGQVLAGAIAVYIGGHLHRVERRHRE